MENGPYGVSLFFTVSGFLITNVIAHYPKGLFKPDFRKFYVQRAGRILPLFFLDVVIGSLIWHFTDQNDWKWFCFYNQGIGPDPWFWLTLLTFTFNWIHFFHGRLILYGSQWLVLWSLSIEEQFYFFFPLVLKKTGGVKKLFWTMIFLIVVAFLWRLGAHFYKPHSNVFQKFNSFAVFDQIAFGVLLQLIFDRHGERISRNLFYNLSFCGIGLAMIVYIFLGTDYENTVDGIYAPFVLGLGVFLFLLGGIALPFWGSKNLRVLSLPGKYCYGIYLIHPTVMRFSLPFFLSRSNEYAALLANILICTALAAVSFNFFEMPMNRLIRRKFEKAGLGL